MRNQFALHKDSNNHVERCQSNIKIIGAELFKCSEVANRMNNIATCLGQLRRDASKFCEIDTRPRRRSRCLVGGQELESLEIGRDPDRQAGRSTGVQRQLPIMKDISG